MTDDVLPWEQMKLRMLNGSHSFLAWLGYLAGMRTSATACRMRSSAAARQLMLDEQAPTLTITGVDLAAYADSSSRASAIRRSNTVPGKSPWTAASYPSACSTVFACILSAAAAGRCWPRRGRLDALRHTDDAGQAIDVRDPLVDKIQRRVAQAMSEARRRPASGGNIWPRPAANALFVAGIRAAWQQLATHGAREAVARALDS
jgi:fructuronate reductase